MVVCFTFTFKFTLDSMVIEKTLVRNNHNLCYAEGPKNGPPLFLLHGVTRAWRDWSVLLPALSHRFQVFAVDFRGHGNSQQAANSYRVIDYVEDAKFDIKKLADSAPMVFGHSLGAMVALAVAADPSLQVRGAILEDPPFATMGSRIQETSFHSLFVGMQSLVGQNKSVAEIAKGLGDLIITNPKSGQSQRLGDLRDPTSLRFSAACLSRLDPQVFTPIVTGQWLVDYDFESYLPDVKAPLMLLQADLLAGGMLTAEDATRIETVVPDCCRIYYPGQGHLLHWMITGEIQRVTCGFLESL